MHRDQIRIFPGDVESQVRRLERFSRSAQPRLASDAGEKVLPISLLDYESPGMRWWEMLLRDAWQQRLFIALLIVYMICCR